MKIIARKKQHLQELLLQQIAFKNLVKRNQKESQYHHEETKIPLPFIIVSTNNTTVVQCEMAEDRSDIFFDFNETKSALIAASNSQRWVALTATSHTSKSCIEDINALVSCTRFSRGTF